MNIDEFQKQGYELIDWIADYYREIEKYPVKSNVKPKEIFNKIPDTPPEICESFDTIFNDFKEIIMPGVTHWQHPSFFAYFPANCSFPSILAELLSAALNTQGMLWQTSPASTELEERVMEWLAQMTGLPAGFTGVIQESASTSTLCSLLSAREKYSDFKVNSKGFYHLRPFTVYCSAEAHSSIEKSVKILGFGKDNLRKIQVDDTFAMIPEKLEEAIRKDKEKGFIPLAVVAAFGTTGSTAIDPLSSIAQICKMHDIWLHVDAAYAGTALLLPEKRSLIEGIDQVDTFIFNPHKWMFTNLDCSAYFVKEKEWLIRALEILPEYLKTREGNTVNNYRDWGIQLGRRFRALKLWFVIRSFGVEGIRQKIRGYIQWAQELAKDIQDSENFELIAPVPFATICFRFNPSNITDETQIDNLNQQLMETLNDSGKLYLTHTRLKGKLVLRFSIGQTYQEYRHIKEAWERIKTTAMTL